MLLFCDTDDTGEIRVYIAGERIIPDRQWRHFFFLNENIIEDLSSYIVINGELIRKEA